MSLIMGKVWAYVSVLGNSPFFLVARTHRGMYIESTTASEIVQVADMSKEVVWKLEHNSNTMKSLT